MEGRDDEDGPWLELEESPATQRRDPILPLIVVSVVPCVNDDPRRLTGRGGGEGRRGTPTKDAGLPAVTIGPMVARWNHVVHTTRLIHQILEEEEEDKEGSSSTIGKMMMMMIMIFQQQMTHTTFFDTVFYDGS